MNPPSEDPMALVPHPEQLSRRISEIDLTSRGPKNMLPEYGPHYSRSQLLNLRSETQDGHVDTPDFCFDGVMTPPYVSPPAVPPSTPANHTPKGDRRVEEGEDLTMPKEEQKKKTKKSSGAGKSKKGVTGFEEYYADPPVTPAEHEEECDLYDESRPFHERIQTCIQRYRRRRKLDETRALIFTKYLILGGIEASTDKSFTGGLDKETVESSTANEIAAITATDFIRAGTTNSKYFDPLKSEGWVVDFEGIVKGFLSHAAPRHIGDFDKQVSLCCAVIKNFLNYVLSHAVCPEYTDNLLAARNICDIAEKELHAINYLYRILPGDFNIAASSLYGGRYKELYLANQAWGAIDPFAKTYATVNQGFNDTEAQVIFKTAIAHVGTDEMFKAVLAEDVKIIATLKRFLEVVKIERADTSTIEQFLSLQKAEGNPGNYKALGRVLVKDWEGPGSENEDMTDEENNEDSTEIDGAIDTLWLEDDILKHLFVGLRLEVTIQELNIGIKVFDDVSSLYCSFHTFLPNEKMNGWKEPTLAARGPPTEDDPDNEEAAMIGEMEKDMKDDEKIGEKLTIPTDLKKADTESKSKEE